MSERSDTAVMLTAPAKLTRTLRITGVRADGYHLLDAEMVTLDLADTVRITPGGTGLTVGGPFAGSVPATEDNLAARALRVTGRRAAVHVDKRIPPGGGLGGGSADAAAVLRWAGFGHGPVELAAAATIGADVPFCLIGGRARVRGVGEVVEPLPAVDLTLTLVVPPFAVDTATVYRRWDALGGPGSNGPNDLEPAAVAVEPRLAAWRERIGELAGATPALAGSGATWFVEGRCDEALASLRGEGATIIVARTDGACDDR